MNKPDMEWRIYFMGITDDDEGMGVDIAMPQYIEGHRSLIRELSRVAMMTLARQVIAHSDIGAEGELEAIIRDVTDTLSVRPTGITRRDEL